MDDAADIFDTTGLDLSQVAMIGPCGDTLPLSVAVQAASMADGGVRRLMRATCPQCGGHIAYIEDKLVRKGRPAVVFKYSNCLYALSIVAAPSSPSPTSPIATSWQSSSDSSLNQQQRRLLLRNTNTTVQERIANALGLVSLKVSTKKKLGGGGMLACWPAAVGRDRFHHLCAAFKWLRLIFPCPLISPFVVLSLSLWQLIFAANSSPTHYRTLPKLLDPVQGQGRVP
jgi:hypothetical protein